jgi:hypothetical protein
MFARPSRKSSLIPDPRSRHPKSGADLILAATAIVHGATVVTAHKGDFLRIHRELGDRCAVPGACSSARDVVRSSGPWE